VSSLIEFSCLIKGHANVDGIFQNLGLLHFESVDFQLDMADGIGPVGSFGRHLSFKWGIVSENTVPLDTLRTPNCANPVSKGGIL